MANPIVQHNPPGLLTHVLFMGRTVLTNATPESLKAEPGALRPSIEVQMDSNSFISSSMGAVIALREVGFFNCDRYPVEGQGKFVFMKRGTFFLSHTGVPHIDLPSLIGIYDRVAVLSAGFIRLKPTGVELFGRSESLDREPYWDGSDYPMDLQVITEHVGIPHIESAPTGA